MAIPFIKIPLNAVYQIFIFDSRNPRLIRDSQAEIFQRRHFVNQLIQIPGIQEKYAVLF